MKRLFLLLLLMLAIAAAPAHAQAPGLIDMNVSVGFAGRFRDNGWTPVQISIKNNGSRSFIGDLVVRPERSRGVTNPVGTPVSLAPDTQQMFTLYVSLRSFADLVRVELMTSDGLLAAETELTVSAVLPRERLYLRVTDGLSRPVDLSAAASFGQSVVETDWFVSNLPDRSVGLEAVDLMLISNANTGQLTPQQRNAIKEWVAGGGHLIVTGGSAWEATAAGVEPLLPFQPSSSSLTSDVAAIAPLSGTTESLPAGETIVARGTLTDDASVLAQDSEGNVLIARRASGYGLVDYLAFDPAAAPFAAWDGLDGLWLSLVSSRDARPGWSYGFLNLTQGYNAVEILPGVTALPEAMAMVGFLLVYVLLIGPVNYFVLSRIGRREFAWFTIPAMIVIFTIVAWVTGFNLRGTEVVLSRLSIVESWPDADTSHVRQLVGLLSPRRANYNLSLPDNRALRPLLRATQGGFFSNQASTVEIIQSDVFSAVDFPVDASFMAGFVTDGATPRVPVRGSLSVTESPRTNTQEWRGSIRNDLSVPLTDIVLLSRAGAIRLDGPLAPGEIRIVEETMAVNPDASVPANPLEYTTTFLTPSQSSNYSIRGRTNLHGPEQSIIDIVGEELYRSALYFGAPLNSGALSQDEQRRQTFLANFVIDQFNSTARGNSVYMLGWTSTAPFEEDVTGANWRAVDTTLYITKLETTIQSAPGAQTHVSPDEFTWTLINDEAATNSTPNLIFNWNTGTLAFRLTPIPTSVLDTVDKLVLIVQRGNTSLSNTDLRLYNWSTGEYETIDLSAGESRFTIPNHERYLGPNNAVQVEIDRFQSAGSLAITRFAFEQYGTRRS